MTLSNVIRVRKDFIDCCLVGLHHFSKSVLSGVVNYALFAPVAFGQTNPVPDSY